MRFSKSLGGHLTCLYYLSKSRGGRGKGSPRGGKSSPGGWGANPPLNAAMTNQATMLLTHYYWSKLWKSKAVNNFALKKNTAERVG